MLARDGACPCDDRCELRLLQDVCQLHARQRVRPVQYGWDQFDAYDRIAKPHMTRYGIRLLDLDPLHYRVEARGLALAALQAVAPRFPGWSKAMVSPSVAGTTARRLTST